ncbi:FtsX-like permease family protein [Aquicoccus sp. SCR17]|nr:FtsX-like permease family protein [Carideicomes alvinocaridis]
MSLPTAARLAARELRGGLRGGLQGFRILIACLALGVAAIAGVGSVRSAIEAGLSAEGASLLGGDAEVEFTYRFATDAERDWLAGRSEALSEVTDFRSMAVVGEGESSERGLTQVKSVDAAYPLLGEVVLEPDMPLARALEVRDGLPGAVMAPLLADRLALAPGDVFRLGDQDFRLSARLVREPDDAGAGFSLGPRTIVRTEALEASGLLSPGTLFETKYRLALPEDADLAALEAETKAQFPESGLRWRDARNGAPGISEFVERLGAFLVLVGLSGLAVGGVGVSAAVRAYIAGKVPVIATLRTLGASRRTIFLVYFIQIGVLSAAGILLGLLLGWVAPLAFAPLIEASLPVPAIFTFYPAPLTEAALYGALTALIFTLWPLARTEQVQAAALFRDAPGGGRRWPRARFLLAILGLLALLVAGAAALSGMAELTLWTAGGIGFALVLLALAGLGITRLARAARHGARGRPALRWALASIGGSSEGAMPVVLSLGLGLSVLAAVGQIDGNLRAAISRDLPDVAPSYFFVDIQQDQIDELRQRMADDPAVSRMDSAPMLRGVLTQINGRPAQEVAGDHWVVQGDRGLTYSAELPERTRITAGEWWPEDYDGPPLVSFAAEEAEEMGLSLGDTVTVNILGRDITATIASFRQVDFSSAGMGFVMSMDPAALQGAPHTFIATVYADQEAEAAILRDVSDSYPNITAISVRDGIARVSELLGGIASAIRWGAAATLLTGLLVLVGAAAAGEGARSYEAAVLKTLGAARARILQSFALRAALLGAAAGAVALAAGIAGAWAVTHFVMQTGFAVIWPNALGIVAGGVLATLLTGLAFAWRPLSARPARILRARE